MKSVGGPWERFDNNFGWSYEMGSGGAQGFKRQSRGLIFVRSMGSALSEYYHGGAGVPACRIPPSQRQGISLQRSGRDLNTVEGMEKPGAVVVEGSGHPLQPVGDGTECDPVESSAQVGVDGEISIENSSLNLTSGVAKERGWNWCGQASSCYASNS